MHAPRCRHCLLPSRSLGLGRTYMHILCNPLVHRVPRGTKPLVLEGSQRRSGPVPHAEPITSRPNKRRGILSSPLPFAPPVRKALHGKEVWWASGGREWERPWELAEGIKKTLCRRTVHIHSREDTSRKVFQSLFSFFIWRGSRSPTQVWFACPIQRKDS